MRILLVRPPRIAQAITLSDFMFSEPLGLEMVFGVLKGGHEVEIFDMMVESCSLSSKIKSWFPDVIGVTSLCIDVLKVIDLCKETKACKDKIITVVGGTQAYLNPNSFFHESIDHIFQYTSTENLTIFYDGLSTGEIQKTDGISNMEIQRIGGVLSKVHQYEPTGLKKHNQYLLPDRKSTEKYRSNYSYFGYKPAAIMEFGIGCEKGCDFCLRWRIEGAKESLIDLNIIKQDLLSIKEKTIMFIDNDFFANKEKIEAFIKIEDELDLDKNYIMYASVEGVIKYRDYIKILKKLGLKAVLIGYETFNDLELGGYNKNSTALENLKAAEILRESGIDVWASFMAHPDWDSKDFQKLRTYIKSLKSQITTISPLTPFPNLPMYEEYKERLIYKANEYEKWSFGQVMITPSKISLRRYYYELLKTSLYVNVSLNSNTEMIEKFGLKNFFGIVKGSLKAARKYFVLGILNK